jgi:hypothetical protein
MTTSVYLLYPTDAFPTALGKPPISCLVYAGSESEARELAADGHPMTDSRADSPWLDPERSSCRRAVALGDPPPKGYRALIYDAE